MNPQTAVPLGVIQTNPPPLGQDSNGFYELVPPTYFHVYQALTTRNGAEVIDGGSY
jgi:hypothetical protein